MTEQRKPHKLPELPISRVAAESFTLPARVYTDPDIFAEEMDAIFQRSWWYAGHVSQLASPGDFLTTQVHNQNVFVVRNRNNELNAFYNVCQHRGHELLSGHGSTRVITCPYHAWAYDLDGTLKSARNTEQMPGFNTCDFSLKPVQVELFCGLVFINLDPGAQALTEQANGLEEEIRRYVPSVDSLQFVQRDRYDVSANWKVLIDNFLECYHCHTAHKAFVDLVDMDSYRSRPNGIYSSHVSGAIKSSDSAAYKVNVGEVDFGYAGWFLWPNLTIWAYPGDANLSVLQMIPDSVDRTVEFQDWFAPGKKPSDQLVDAMVYQKEVLQPEDIGLCESVQKGLQSNGYNQGRFVTDVAQSELSEHAVHHFQIMVADALGIGIDSYA